METYDAIVIGGGPGGAVCARELAARGRRVLLLERDAPDRYKPCAGGISPRTALVTPMPPGVVEREVTAARIFSPKQNEITMELKGQVGWVVYRHRYDAALRDMARDAGAEVAHRAEATRIEVESDRVRVDVRTSDGEKEFSARAVAGAFGFTHGRKFLKQLGVAPPPPILCVCIEAALPKERVDERIGSATEFYFGTRIVPGGYAWLYPRRAGVSAGLASRNPAGGGSLKSRLDDFINRHPVASEKMKGWEPLFDSLKASSFGHLIPLRPVERSFGDRFVLVGDAAGTADCLTGEGIYHAQVSGKIAAEVLSEQLEKDALGAAGLERYETLWREALHNHGTRYTAMVARIIDTGGCEDGLTELLIDLADRDGAMSETMLSVFTGGGTSRRAFRRVMTFRNLARTLRHLGWRGFSVAAAGIRLYRSRKRF